MKSATGRSGPAAASVSASPAAPQRPDYPPPGFSVVGGDDGSAAEVVEGLSPTDDIDWQMSDHPDKILVIWLWPLTPEAIQLVGLDNHFPNEAYFNVMERIRDRATIVGHTLKSDGCLWVECQTEKQAQHLERRLHDVKMVGSRYRLSCHSTNRGAWPAEVFAELDRSASLSRRSAGQQNRAHPYEKTKGGRRHTLKQ